MKPNEPGEYDEPLHKVLQEWRVEAPLPSRFQESVWQRIEPAQTTATPSVWAIIVHWIGTVLPRPALAVSYVAVVLTIGATAGWAQARQEAARLHDELGHRYVRLLDPYQAPRQ